MKKPTGCVHLIIKQGKVANVALHVSKLPKNGVIHPKPDDVYPFAEFKKSHPEDVGELKNSDAGRIARL